MCICIFFYTRRYVNTISLIISCIIFIIINILLKFDFKIPPIFEIFNPNIITVEIKSDSIKRETEEKNSKNITNELYQNNPNNKSKEETGLLWKISIPAINLEANIAEGTEKSTMDSYVGHFSETSKTNGNIGLAAHNRGYPVNYFENLKKLKENDEIVYQYMDFKERYVVKSNIIIKDTDWSYLEKTDRNAITLITCVENEPEYRRCVYGIKKE